MKKILLVIIILFIVNLGIAKTIEYSAEHIIESQMNARYLTLLTPPFDLDKKESRLNLGYLKLGADELKSDTMLISFSRYNNLNERFGIVYGLSFDYNFYSGQNGSSSSDPIFAKNLSIVTPFSLKVKKVSGNGYHSSIGSALTLKVSTNFVTALGVALEQIKVDQFRIDFITTSLTTNFNGYVDFAGTYYAFTPFWLNKWRVFPSSVTTIYSLQSIFALPLPRSGFKGKIVGPNLNSHGDSKEAGRGVHFPDPYVGLGFSLESVKSGLRLDLGASLYMFLVENRINDGLDRPIFFSMSFPFGKKES